jgi:hypothetical protein
MASIKKGHQITVMYEGHRMSIVTDINYQPDKERFTATIPEDVARLLYQQDSAYFNRYNPISANTQKELEPKIVEVYKKYWDITVSPMKELLFVAFEGSDHMREGRMSVIGDNEITAGFKLYARKVYQRRYEDGEGIGQRGDETYSKDSSGRFTRDYSRGDGILVPYDERTYQILTDLAEMSMLLEDQLKNLFSQKNLENKLIGCDINLNLLPFLEEKK